MQQAILAPPHLFAHGRGSREYRTEMLWEPTKGELRAKFLALTQEQLAALTWDEALGFVMPHDIGELQAFKGLQELGNLAPWEAVMAIREARPLIEPVTVIGASNFATENAAD